MPNLEKEAAGYQIDLFQLLAEFFGRATGILPRNFATIENFDEEIRKQASMLAHRSEDAFTWADKELRRFYVEKGPTIFRVASRLGGLKLGLGGSSRFLGSQLAAVNGSLLYADTILIPDPIAPWLGKERKEEKFRHVLMLQAAHALLHLKPIVDAKLPHCPVLVFPRWEKLLEDTDPQTIKGTSQLLTDVLAQFVDPGIASMDDAVKFIHDRPDQFIQAIEQHKLLVAPGGPIGEPFADALARYEKNLETWRTKDWQEDYHQLSPAGKAMNALTERLTPQYHLLENSEELKSHPLICIEQQAHYFKLVSQVNSGRLERIGLLDKKTKPMLAGLTSNRLAWLSQVPIDALVELRENNEHQAFRKCLTVAVGNLHDSAIEDTDRVAAEICHEIDSGIANHTRLIKEIDTKYADKTLKTVAVAAIAVLGAFHPSLAPYLGSIIPPTALAGKLAWDVWEKVTEKKRRSRSLMGVLAIARSANQKD
jgi:hypothetical protein